MPCLSCVALPLAFAGMSAGGAGGLSKNKILIMIAVFILLIALGIIVYYKFYKKDCKSCKKK